MRACVTALLLAFAASQAWAVRTPSPHCTTYLARFGDGDPFAMTVHVDHDTKRWEAGPWDAKRFDDAIAMTYQDAEDPVVFQGLLDAYAAATGSKVEVDVTKELTQYLADRGLKPEDMRVLDGGAQGVLLTHPTLGNQIIKVQRESVNNGNVYGIGGSATTTFGDPKGEKVTLADFRKALAVIDQMAVDHPASAAMLASHRAKLIQAQKNQAKNALTRAYQMMVPGLVAASETSTDFDFAHVHFVGNGFFVREYYPDSVTHGEAARAAGDLRPGTPPHPDDGLRVQLEAAQKAGKAQSPVMKRLFGHLVAQTPSYFVSPTLYRASSAAGRPRLYVIYDID